MPSNKQVAKHTEILQNIHTIQDKIEQLADQSLLQDGAFLELANTNKELYIKMKRQLQDCWEVKVVYETKIVKSRFVQSHEDPNYHKRQVLTRQQKIGATTHRQCRCGDWVSKRKDFYKRHLSTEKCASSCLRIDYDKYGHKALFCLCPIDQMLIVNSHINRQVYGRAGHRYLSLTGEPRLQILERLIRRWRIGRMGMGHLVLSNLFQMDEY